MSPFEAKTVAGNLVVPIMVAAALTACKSLLAGLIFCLLFAVGSVVAVCKERHEGGSAADLPEAASGWWGPVIMALIGAAIPDA